MLERFLKSPVFSVLGLILLGALLVVAQKGWFELNYILIAFLLLVVSFWILVRYNNKKFPHKKVNVDNYVPHEFREEDEGLQWVTFKACRKVYLFYYFAIPVGMTFAVTFYNSIPFFTVWVLVLLGIIQQLIYWSEVRKVMSGGKN